MEVKMKRGRLCRRATFLLAICFCVSVLTACGDGIREETKQAVLEKTDEAMQLYADLESLVAEHGLEVDASFRNMKTQLSEMSEKIKQQIDDTTEEDGKKASDELKKIIENLQEVKDNVERSLTE